MSELESFIATCQDHREPVTTGEDGIHALNVAIAAIESYKSRSMVKIISKSYTQPAGPTNRATV